MSIVNKFVEFYNFCLDHGNTLKHHIFFGERGNEIVTDLYSLEEKNRKLLHLCNNALTCLYSMDCNCELYSGLSKCVRCDTIDELKKVLDK